ncbi:uncharacterized protein LOC135372079 [Ornithodoros turicata]|uniref:uncharacterized protein LOC135372079 n=1 Tax=Ornithodoros turicata TaxID=34597 RepID=UPI0031395985
MDYHAGEDIVSGGASNIDPTQASQDTRPKRKVSLSLKALEKFASDKEDFGIKLDRAWEETESNVSSVCASAAKARADAETAKVRSANSKKEAELKLRRAQIEEQEQVAAATARRRKAEWKVSFQLLQQERDVAAAETQARVLEVAAEAENLKLYDAVTDTSELDRDRFAHGTPSDVLTKDVQVTEDLTLEGTHTAQSNGEHTQRAHPAMRLLQGSLYASRQADAVQEIRAHNTRGSAAPLNATDSTFVPVGQQLSMGHPVRTSSPGCESAGAGSTQYEDILTAPAPQDPSSFKNATNNLDITASEELDLMVKWLGRESSRHVRRLRSVHINNPSAGVRMAWERLDETFGSAEAIENALLKRLDGFSKISNNDHPRLRELGDLLLELESAKSDPRLSGLSYLDTGRGVNPIVEKLPSSIQEKWITHGSRYKEQNRNRRNEDRSSPGNPGTTPPVIVNKTDVQSAQANQTTHSTEPVAPSSKAVKDAGKECPLHRKPHSLNKCRGFRQKPLTERRAMLKEFGVCFRCCSSIDHFSKDCRELIKCSVCGSDGHASALHPDPIQHEMSPSTRHSQDGGEEDSHVSTPEVMSKCTNVCGDSSWNRSCSKICLVRVHPKSQPERSRKMYAVLDDQSNRSLARPSFFDMFNVHGDDSPYTLKTCAGIIETTGRRANGVVVESIDRRTQLQLPTLIECTQIPDDRSEIPTPEVAHHHPHLRKIAHLLQPLEDDAAILLLLGRDILQVHKVRQQVNGSSNAPYAQRLDLGWVIVGDICINGIRKPTSINVFRTTLIEDNRASVFAPCPGHVFIREKIVQDPCVGNAVNERTGLCDTVPRTADIGSSVFDTTKDDNKIALSIEDRHFLEMMEEGFTIDDENSWVAPLPFRAQRRVLPDNRDQAMSRFTSLRRTLERKPEVKNHFLAFMAKVLANGHAELAPEKSNGQEYWYLPIFGVYHPRKPGQIRVVFDSSAKFQGISLNDVLLSGPNLVNSLLGVLLRFRKEAFAVTADIQQMFYCFVVREEHRDFLRFFWFLDNDPTKEVVEYRMRVHVFGNSPSPAVATYGLRRTAIDGEEQFGTDVREFVEKNFYVDDGLTSLPAEQAAIDLLRRTPDMLSTANLRLHKIASNSVTVMKAFSSDEYATDLKDLDLGSDVPPSQRSLGLRWDIKGDTFTFHVPPNEKPHTKRGVLSTVNSLYDPLGFAAPVTIQGRLLLRELSSLTQGWDDELPKSMEWETWRDSLPALTKIEIPRTYGAISLSSACRRELCIFSEASTKAIAAVACLRSTDPTGETHVGFVLGKAKLAPKREHTIPRLELCGTLLAVEMADVIVNELDVSLDAIKFYTDSRVVLGYICNESRRFYVYVSNRVERIRRSSHPDQWNYVPSDKNPADVATRTVSAGRLAETTWLTGPDFQRAIDIPMSGTACDTFQLVDPGGDEEVRPLVTTFATNASLQLQLGSQRFERFSSWTRLVRAIVHLQHIARSFQSQRDAASQPCRHWHLCGRSRTDEELSTAEKLVIANVQRDAFPREVRCLAMERVVPKDSPLWKLDPYIDEDGLIRIGGRLRNSTLSQNERHPIVVPPRHHIATLLI